MSVMRWAVGCVTAVALALGCSSPLAPQRSLGGPDAAVDRAPRPIGATAVDAARDVGPGPSPIIDAAPDFVDRGELGPAGVLCRSGIDCLTGFCVDGVCCNSSCAGPCSTCAAPGAAGTCVSRTVGAGPRVLAACPVSDVRTCGLSGLCDGRGGCALYEMGAACMPPACVDGMTLRQAGICDGFGSCVGAVMRSCAPYTCIDGACFADDCQLDPADCDVRPNRDASLD